MNKMLKSLSLAAIVVLAFVACSKTEDTPTPVEPTSEPTATIVPTLEEPTGQEGHLHHFEVLGRDDVLDPRRPIVRRRRDPAWTRKLYRPVFVVEG